MGTVSPLSHSNSTETGLRFCSCCYHADCASLQEHRFCSQWYFLRWAASSLAVPHAMVLELRARLGKRVFYIQPVVWRLGIYEALVRIEPAGHGVEDMTSALFPVEGSGFFNGERSTVYCLRCCWGAVKDNVPRWLSTSRAVGDDVRLGETDLGRRLINEIRQAAQGSGHIVQN